MAENTIYETIAKRTDGNIYIGVVGPVRTGKSTFVHKLLEKSVLPNIKDDNDRQRTIDVLPQSGSGKTITTTEPKFLPDEAVSVTLGNAEMKLRVIDCVGFTVDGALGCEEDGEERTVMTPWSDEAIPFSVAASIGTKRVLCDHSTVAVLVTTDGSVCDIEREAYIAAEEQTVNELKASGKPFAIVLNSSKPQSKEAHTLALSLEEKYSAPVALVDCSSLSEEDIDAILSLVVGEFPVSEIRFKLPDWYSLLDGNDSLVAEVITRIRGFASCVSKLSDIPKFAKDFDVTPLHSDASNGSCEIDVPIDKAAFFEAISTASGLNISSDKDIFVTVKELAAAKLDYDKIKDALECARERGYGIVTPAREDMRISEPRLVKQGQSYGICVSASADTIHMIRADIKADVCPVIGTEEQSLEVIKLMRDEYMENPEGILSTKMLGRSLYDLVNDGMNTKLCHISDESREKLGKTLERIVNDGASGLICILV